jgi:hypothetical protein
VDAFQTHQGPNRGIRPGWSKGEAMTKLRDPERCPKCNRRGIVIDSRKRKGGYRTRRHRCGPCKVTWPSYQTTIDPRRIQEDRW